MAEQRKSFPFKDFEPKWQGHWEADKTFSVPNPGEAGFDASRPKYYVLDMFPYPSGSGLHVGHPEGYTATDIITRYKRMRGFNVLHPMGWDAFGLPAEEHARKTGEHPAVNTRNNIDNFRGQLKRLGFAYDWDREVNTTSPDYVRWTQWIFLQLYHSYYDETTQKARPISELDGLSRGEIDAKRLAYVAEAPVNWCPELGTVLANEEVEEWRAKGNTVERRPLKQWMLRITAYAQRLIDELDGLDWPEGIKLLQKNWIGRSEGAEVDFEIAGTRWIPVLDAEISSRTGTETYSSEKLYLDPITVFTTRPDTLFGATYMVLAPEHPIIRYIIPMSWPENTPETWKGEFEPSRITPEGAVHYYRSSIAWKSDLERTELAKEKTGVFTGAFAINPVDGKEIPIWIADYVMMSYGTGAIMAVPAHDQRDFEFAKQYGIPIKQVVLPSKNFENIPFEEYSGILNQSDGMIISDFPYVEELKTFVGYAEPSAYTNEGIAINSGFLDGLPTPEAKAKIIAWLGEKGLGKKTINYKLRDWLFSRQRYWGEPFPLVWKDGRHSAVADSELPLLAPELEDYKPSGSPEPILSKATAWVDLGNGVTRETNTMPQWAGSCWYYLRYCDARNTDRFMSREAEDYWLGKNGKPGGVDLYVGGTEHAVLHLLYARFWHKVLFDLGHVSTPEPFQKLVNQGLILGELEYFVFSPSGSMNLISAEGVTITREFGAGGLIGVDQNGNDVKGAPLKDGASKVEKRNERFYLKDRPDIAVEARAFKMSKSRGNVVNPDDVITEYGADSLRLYEMFMGPLEQVKPWSMKGVEGVYRFLARVWRLVMETNQEGEWVLNTKLADIIPDKATNKVVHATMKKVGEDIDAMSFNTAISQMMVCTNEFTKLESVPVSSIVLLLRVLNPFAPHLTEELNATLAAAFPSVAATDLANQSWPEFDPAKLIEDEIEIVLQVNGKVREKLFVANGASNEEVEKLALESEKVKSFTAGLTIRKVIVVPGRLVNVVAN